MLKVLFRSSHSILWTTLWGCYHIFPHLHACVLSCFSCVWLFVTLWTIAHRAPLSMGFSRQEYWSGLPCSSSKESFRPRDWTYIFCVSCIGRPVLYPQHYLGNPFPPLDLEVRLTAGSYLSLHLEELGFKYSYSASPSTYTLSSLTFLMVTVTP